MQTFLERMIWADPSLVFPSFGHLQVKDRAWVERKPYVRLHGYLQEKGGGIHNPVTRRWAACTGPRREARSTGKRIIPT